jgi:hypothetical protein
MDGSVHGEDGWHPGDRLRLGGSHLADCEFGMPFHRRDGGERRSDGVRHRRDGESHCRIGQKETAARAFTIMTAKTTASAVDTQASAVDIAAGSVEVPFPAVKAHAEMVESADSVVLRQIPAVKAHAAVEEGADSAMHNPTAADVGLASSRAETGTLVLNPLTWGSRLRLRGSQTPELRNHPPAGRYLSSLGCQCAVKRRRFPVGANPTRQLVAPAGSNRSGGGGDEAIEASGVEGRRWATWRTCRPKHE